MPIYEISGDDRATASHDKPLCLLQYLEKALPAEPQLSSITSLSQRGFLRPSPTAKKWMEFSATESFWNFKPQFIWKANIRVAPCFHLHLTDTLLDGEAQCRQKLGFVSLGHQEARAELNSGALHRYIAEMPWHPLAFLHLEGLYWESHRHNSAIARLNNENEQISLEFRFNQHGEIERIFTPGRWGFFDGRYRQCAWEGHFRDYLFIDGYRVPGYGEVGWYSAGEWAPVWKGHLKSR